MISHKLKFIFIHIPKTSGNSLSFFFKDLVDNEVIQITNNLGEKQGISIMCELTSNSIKHVEMDYYTKLYGDRIKDYYKFTIVRNPYDRLLSFYFWSKGKDDQLFDRTEFIEYIHRNDKVQHKYITPDMNIIYFENLIGDLKQIPIFQNICDFDNYPRINCSANSYVDRDAIYDKELKDIVYTKYKKDFDLFGYKY